MLCSEASCVLFRGRSRISAGKGVQIVMGGWGGFYLLILPHFSYLNEIEVIWCLKGGIQRTASLNRTHSGSTTAVYQSTRTIYIFPG